MKKNVLVLVCCLHTLFFATAHTTSVTPQAKESFKKAFPGALYATWETVDAGVYAVRFVNNHQSAIAYYGEDGNPLGLGSVIALSQLSNLPASVQQTLQRSFHNYTIRSAQEWVLPTSRLYCFDIASGETVFSVSIDETGKLQRKKPLQHF